MKNPTRVAPSPVPLGWQARYEINVGEDKLESVLEWRRARGITVWANHDLGSVMSCPRSFTPGDVKESPGWRYTANPVEVLSPEMAVLYTRVVKVERWVGAGLLVDCEWCLGKGTRTQQDWDRRRAEGKHEPSRAPFLPEGVEEIPCWMCKDGKRTRGLHLMSVKEKSQAMKKLRDEGWELEYNRRIWEWVGSRWTTVKDYGEE